MSRRPFATPPKIVGEDNATEWADSRSRRELAVSIAQGKTKVTGRKFVARTVDRRVYFIVPLYQEGQEGKLLDRQYEAMGDLIRESMD